MQAVLPEVRECRIAELMARRRGNTSVSPDDEGEGGNARARASVGWVYFFLFLMRVRTLLLMPLMVATIPMFAIGMGYGGACERFEPERVCLLLRD